MDTLRSGPFATVVTVLVVFTGAYGSLYSDRIKEAFPFEIAQGPVVHEAIVFWALLLLTGALYWARQHSIDWARKLSESQFRSSAESLLSQSTRLEAQTAKLEDLYRTLPPGDFLEAFNKSYAECSRNVYELLRGDEATRAPRLVDAAVVMLLKAMGGLARHFDDTPGRTVYAANVMIFIPEHECPDGLTALDIKFVDGDVRRGELAGILQLVVDYSVELPSEESPAPGARPFALPVPRIQRTAEQRWRALPGAPMAFCTERACCYQDTSTMADWCDSEGDFVRTVKSALREYFRPENTPDVRSLVSLPITALGLPCKGVVNIHRDAPNILRRTESHELFFNLMVPFCTLLAYLTELPTFRASQAPPAREDPPNGR